MPGSAGTEEGWPELLARPHAVEGRMTRTVRIGVIGGGSVFTPELIEQLAVYAPDIGAMEVRLMDVEWVRKYWWLDVIQKQIQLDFF